MDDAPFHDLPGNDLARDDAVGWGRAAADDGARDDRGLGLVGRADDPALLDRLLVGLADDLALLDRLLVGLADDLALLDRLLVGLADDLALLDRLLVLRGGLRVGLRRRRRRLRHLHHRRRRVLQLPLPVLHAQHDAATADEGQHAEEDDD